MMFFLLSPLCQIGIWYSNNTLAMNSTSLDINVSETLANKTLIVTTILVSFLCRGLEMRRRSVGVVARAVLPAL